jgi:hypothetical protein
LIPPCFVEEYLRNIASDPTAWGLEEKVENSSNEILRRSHLYLSASLSSIIVVIDFQID